MKVSGRMIYSMALVLRHGLMGPDTKVTTLRAGKMALVLMNGMMVLNILVIGWRTRSVE